MVLLGVVVDIVYGVNDIDDILYGHRLVGTEHDGGIALSGNLGADTTGQLVVSDGRVVHIVLEEVVDIDRNRLLGHGLAAAGGQQQLDGIGCHQGGGQHEKDQQQEDQVRHGRGVEADSEFVSCLDSHDRSVFNGLGGLVEHIHEFSGFGFEQVDDVLDSRYDDGVEDVGDDANDQTADGGDHGLVDAS